MSHTSDPLFAAIAHPARRAILERCLLEDEVPVTELASLPELAGATASALSQHLRVLRDAGLLHARRDGRQFHYRLTPEPLLEILEFAEAIKAGWERRLDDLGKYLDANASSVRHKRRKVR